MDGTTEMATYNDLQKYVKITGSTFSPESWEKVRRLIDRPICELSDEELKAARTERRVNGRRK